MTDKFNIVVTLHARKQNKTRGSRTARTQHCKDKFPNGLEASTEKQSWLAVYIDYNDQWGSNRKTCAFWFENLHFDILTKFKDTSIQPRITSTYFKSLISKLIQNTNPFFQ